MGQLDNCNFQPSTVSGKTELKQIIHWFNSLLMFVCGRATHLLIINWMGSVGDRLLSVFMSANITLDRDSWIWKRWVHTTSFFIIINPSTSWIFISTRENELSVLWEITLKYRKIEESSCQCEHFKSFFKMLLTGTIYFKNTVKPFSSKKLI